MADTEFSSLAATNILSAGDQLLVVRGGVAYRFTGSLPTLDSGGRLTLTAGYSSPLSSGVRVNGSIPGFVWETGATGSRKNFAALANYIDNGIWTLLYSTAAGGEPFNVAFNFDANALQLRPGGDATTALGSGAARWSVVYASTGSISTSDEREKTWRGDLTDAHIRAARRIIAEVGLFQWNDAIAEKGADSARLHIGPRAQAVARIMVDEGLEEPFEDGTIPHFRHAFLCYDRWDATPAQAAVDEVRGETGDIVTPAQPAIAAVPAGDRFGLRIDQLTLFLMAALLGGDAAA